jgi:hypothetical protein
MPVSASQGTYKLTNRSAVHGNSYRVSPSDSGLRLTISVGIFAFCRLAQLLLSCYL